MPWKRMKLRTAAELTDRALELADLAAESTAAIYLQHSLDELDFALSQTGDFGYQRDEEMRNASILTFAKRVRDELQGLTDLSVFAGELKLNQLFDVDYQPIVGSSPERYQTSLSDWVAEHWRPLFDRATHMIPDVYSVVASDMNGFLPTHISSRSQPPCGDMLIDIARCRAGRISYDARLHRYKQSRDDHILTIHRMEGYDGDDLVCRLLFVPLHFAGRRWGDLEVAYSLG